MAETISTISDLDTYLKSASVNTKDTPYEIILNDFTIDDFGGSVANDSSILAIILFNKKYVKLSFSESTKANLQQLTDLSNLFRTNISIEKANEFSFNDTLPENPYIVAIDTSVFINTIKADEAFSGCSGLLEIDTSNFSNVESAMKMFYNCKSLKTIDTSNFTKVTQATAMFANSGLEEIDTIGFSNLSENTTWMFQNCTKLKTLNARGFVKVIYWYQTVQNCTSLKEVTNFICPIDTTQTTFDFDTGTNTLYKIPYSNNLRKNIATTLVKIRINEDNSSAKVRVQSVNKNSASNLNLDLVNDISILQTNGNLDEEAIDNQISDTQFDEMIKYKVQWAYPKNIE